MNFSAIDRCGQAVFNYYYEGRLVSSHNDSRCSSMTQSSKCSYCGYKNRDGVLFCEECAFPLTDLADDTAKESQMEQVIEQFRRAATDRFGQEAILVLHIRNEAEPLVIEIGEGNVA